MSKQALRIEQFETVRYDTNVNPLGAPESVKKAISENIDSIGRYPDVYYRNLRKTISEYIGAPTECLTLGNGSADLIRLFVSIHMPKKSLVITPGSTEYENVLKGYGSEVSFFELKEEEDFTLNMDELLAALDDSYDMLIIGNPNNPTGKAIPFDEMGSLIDRCESLGIFVLIDEMYIEFTDNEKELTAVPLTENHENMAVLRSVTKFFAVPGLRFAYAVINNPVDMQIIDLTVLKNNLGSLSAIAGSVMFNDRGYIEQSKSIIHTERSLVYLAMSTCKTIKLYKPDANFMLMRLLKEDLYAKDVAEHCNTKGIVLRRCDDIRGLGNKYIRFCFMNPKQNDLMVNTILEIV